LRQRSFSGTEEPPFDPEFVYDSPGPPEVTVASGEALAAESGSTAGHFIFTRRGDTTDSLQVHYSVFGSASAGIDYQTLPGSVVIAAGATSAIVPVNPFDDLASEGVETVLVTLTSSSSYIVTGEGRALVGIVDNEAVLPNQATVTVSALDSEGAEIGADPAIFQFTRSGGNLSSNLPVFYTVSGTAVQGEDYSGLVPPDTVGMVMFAPFQTTALATVTPVDDLVTEGDESVVVSLFHNEVGESWVAGLGGGIGWQAAVVLLNGAPGGGGGGGAVGTGLTGQYFNQQPGATPDMAAANWQPDLSQVALRRVDGKIDFAWGTASPGAGVNADKFVVQTIWGR
jgi:hypothetical protein